jgi:hypothetical protein
LKRNCRFELRLSREEFSDLTKKARKAKLSTAGFVRRAIRGQEVKAAPEADVPVLLQEVRRVGRDLDQLCKAAAQGSAEEQQLQAALAENRAVAKQIIRAYAMTED